MAHDFVKKEPTKNEKMIYELFMNQQNMEKSLWSTSTLVITLAMLTNAEPEKIAELMVNGNEQIREFSKKVNDAIKVLEDSKQANAPETPIEELDHNHDVANTEEPVIEMSESSEKQGE